MKIIFFGTSSFAATILEALLGHGADVPAIVTRPDRPKGRSGKPSPSAVKMLVQEKFPNVLIHQPEKASDPEFMELLQAYEADLFIVAAYGEILKQRILDMPSIECVNIHASLLPQYRGAAPIQRCLIDGVTETGITLMKMVLKMDAGEILQSVKIPVSSNINAGELEKQLAHLGAECLVQSLPAIEAGTLKGIPQDERLVTYAPKIELEDCEVHWELPAVSLHNLIRGVTPAPGAWCWVWVRGERKRLKILASKILPSLSGIPGSILQWETEGLIVACGTGALVLQKLQLEGKKGMSADEFKRGYSVDILKFNSLI